MIARNYEIRESKGIIWCMNDAQIERALLYLRDARNSLEGFVSMYPDFAVALDPWTWDERGPVPRVVSCMLEASSIANVGPMAAVAGALVDVVCDKMLSNGDNQIIMENGGEVRVCSVTPVTVALKAGKASIGERIGFVIPPGCPELASCGTSSATIGHALSFGKADAVTVFCKDASLADAAATAICNATKSPDPEISIKDALDHARGIKGITGVFVAMNDLVGTWGRLPEIIHLQNGSPSVLV